MGTFSAKKGHGKAFLIANAAELEDKKYAEVSLKIPNAKALTIYSDGLKDEILGNQAKISLKPGAGAFVTAEY